MADLLFADGFENLAFVQAKASWTAGASLTTGPGGRGSAISLSGVQTIFSDSATYRLYSFRFKPTGTSGAIIYCYVDANSYNWRLLYDATTYYLVRQDGVNVASVGRNNDWAYHELQINRSGSSAIRWRVNGVDVVNTGTYSTSDTFDTSVRINGGAGFFDDMLLWSNPATDMSDMLGPVAVERLVPTSDGTHTDWTGTYADVDEVPHSTADAISAAAASDRESFNLSSPTNTPLTIPMVVWEMTARGRPVKPLVRTSGVTGVGAQITLPDEYGLVQSPVYTNPATALAWAPGDETSEFGVEAQ